MILDIRELDVSTKESVGGKSGSMRIALKSEAKSNPILFQLKPSARKKLADKFTDRKNYAEFIVACMAKEIVRSLKVNLEIPEICFVTCGNQPKFYPQIASRYLTGKYVINLDDYARENGCDIPPHQHVRIVANNVIYPHDLNINQTTIKKSLAFGLALSMIFGDHDVNPGNMLIITDDDDNSTVARIDFGHGLQSLLRGLSQFGGGIAPDRNAILDFINRKTIAGINQTSQQNKLWRDYPGMVFSTELADALECFSKTTPQKIDSAIDKAKAELKDVYLWNANKKHIIRSLCQLYKNIDRDGYPELKKMTKNRELHNEIIDTIFERISQFVKKNCKDSGLVAQRLHVQLAIEEHIALTPEEIKLRLSEQFKSSIIGDEQTIEWVKTHAHEDAFEGTLDAYIIHRKNIFENKMQRSNINLNENCLAIQPIYPPLFKKTNDQSTIAPKGNNVTQIIGNIEKFIYKNQKKMDSYGLSILTQTLDLLNAAEFLEAEHLLQACLIDNNIEPTHQWYIETLVEKIIALSASNHAIDLQEKISNKEMISYGLGYPN